MLTRLVVASLAVVRAACGGQSEANTPTPTAIPYVATESGFSAVFPATPAKQTQKVNQPGINADLTLYTATTNDEQVIVGYEPLPLAPQRSEIQSRLDAGVAGSASNTNGTVLSKGNTTFLGQPAEDAVLQAQGAVVHERIVFFGSKLYIFDELQGEDQQRRSWRSRQPLGGEERDDRDLRRHQQLPEMGRRPLIGLAGRAEDRDVTEDQGKSGDRHRQREQRRGSLQRGDRQA